MKVKSAAIRKRLALKGGTIDGSPRAEQSSPTDPSASSGSKTRRKNRTRVVPTWKWHYHRLMQLLETLRGAQRGHLRDAAQTNPNFSMSMADGATDEFDRDLLLSEASSEQDVMYEIEQALKRIENGTYGVCEVTGEAISKARLRTIPWTRFSQSAKVNLERNGTIRAAHLGDLGSVRRAGEIRPAAELKQPEQSEGKRER